MAAMGRLSVKLKAELMDLNTQYKIFSNNLLHRFLRENSYWYKILTRDPSMFKEFVNEVKVNYKLRPIDKINDALSTIEMMQTIISTMK